MKRRHKRIMTKIFSLALSIIVILAMMPGTAFAVEEDVVNTEAEVTQDTATEEASPEETLQEETPQEEEVITENPIEDAAEVPVEATDEATVEAKGENDGEGDISAGVILVRFFRAPQNTAKRCASTESICTGQMGPE